MIMLKRYSLYALMLNSFCLFAMEHAKIVILNVDTCAADIRDKIDRDHLGINKNICFRRIVGSCVSCYKNKLLTYQKAADEMNKIESYISSEEVNKKLVLEKLAAHHWYVNYLMQALVCKKIDELEDVKGSTIDALYDFIDESDVEKMVYNEACKKLFLNVPHGLWNIHCTVLYGPNGDLQPSSLAMSTDGTYVRATDFNNAHLVWDMKEGKRIFLSGEDRKNVTWVHGDNNKNNSLLGVYSSDLYEKRYSVSDDNDKYYATVDQPGAFSFLKNSPVEIKDCKAIILSTRSQEASFFCQQAFANSYKNREELIALRDSKSINAIEGFPKNNINKLIESRIDELTLTRDL
jgi:hypothetical protein